MEAQLARAEALCTAIAEDFDAAVVDYEGLVALREARVRRSAMNILHPFAVVERWSEHGDAYDRGARNDPDGRRHIHVVYADGACVCVVATDEGVVSLTSNRLFVPIDGTDDVRLEERPGAGED